MRQFSGRDMCVADVLEILQGTNLFTPVRVGDAGVESIDVSSECVTINIDSDHISTEDVAELLQSIRSNTKVKRIDTLIDNFCSEWGIEL